MFNILSILEKNMIDVYCFHLYYLAWLLRQLYHRENISDHIVNSTMRQEADKLMSDILVHVCINAYS